MPHEKTMVKGRLRCVLCCRKCFTCEEEPQVKERNDFHIPMGRNKNTGCKKGFGRLGNYANKQCGVCKVPLCTKKNRFPNVRKTCWELWHTEADLVNGLCETLCHVKNPRTVYGDNNSASKSRTCTKQRQQSEKRETERLNGCWLRA